jgi:hypothetical protein
MAVMVMKGLTLVIEGKRINLRVYRRLFYPISKTHEGKDFLIYSDSKRETEINYKRTEDYNLENPFNRIKLIRMARAMNCIRINPEDPQEYQVTICTNRELYDPESEEIRYIPFDPKRLKPLDERIRRERRKIDWENRMKS